jgi:hypothetical protein
MMRWDDGGYRPTRKVYRWRDRVLVALVIVGTFGLMAWAGHVGAVRECRAAVASGSWEGTC